jgi:mycothiol system anti-sigma-R factor
MRRCEEIAELLYQYLDRELSDQEYKEIRQHLDDCPPCKHVFKLEENMLTLVGECCRRVCAPPNLIDRIRRLSHERIE